MRPPLACLLFASIAVAASAADNPGNIATPKPRVRLDPVSLTAISEPTKSDREVADASKVFMEKYVVHGQSIIPRRETPAPTEKFSASDGGRFFGGDTGPFHIEVGLWTSVDVMREDNRYKAPKTRVDVDLLRISW